MLFAVFFIFLFFLITLDILMIISLIRTGDERQKLIVWKTSTFTLLVVVGTLVIDIIESLVKVEAMLINPFVKLSVTAMTYFLVLLFYKRKHGD